MLERLLIVLAAAILAAGICMLVRGVARRRAGDTAGDPLAPDVARRLGIDAASIIYFSGPHCAPCRQQAAILREITTETGIRVITVDAAREAGLADAFSIMTVPATVVLDGERRVRAVNLGLRPGATLKEQLTAPGQST